MTEIDEAVPDAELETFARAALTTAVADVAPSAALERRVLEGARRGRPRRWSAAAAAVVLLVAATTWVVVRHEPRATDVETRRDDGPTEPPIPPRQWWTDVGSSWTELPAVPGQVWSEGASVSRERVVLWDAAGPRDNWRGTGTGVRLDAVGWERIGASSPAWQVGVSTGGVDRSDPVTLVAGSWRGASEVGDVWDLVTVVGNSGGATVTPLGTVDPVDSYLRQAPALLVAPEELGGGVWVFSHEGGNVAGGLVVVPVDGGGSTIAVPGLRPLAVGVAPGGEPVVLTQVLAPSRRPSDVVAFARIDGEWTEVGRSTFSEAAAVWTGDRFVVASNQIGSPELANDAAAVLTPGPASSEWRWDVIEPSGIGTCEGPVEVFGDGTGGVVAWSCGRAAFLRNGATTWEGIPDLVVDGTRHMSPVGAFDGIVVALDSGLDGTSRLWAIDLRRTADTREFLRCPWTTHGFERPSLAGDSGDGLPKSGSATRAAAVSGEPDARVTYRATKSEIIEVDGRAWRKDDGGSVEIVPERLTVLLLTLAGARDCPDAAVFSPVPVFFQYPVR